MNRSPGGPSALHVPIVSPDHAGLGAVREGALECHRPREYKSEEYYPSSQHGKVDSGVGAPESRSEFLGLVRHKLALCHNLTVSRFGFLGKVVLLLK